MIKKLISVIIIIGVGAIGWIVWNGGFMSSENNRNSPSTDEQVQGTPEENSGDVSAAVVGDSIDDGKVDTGVYTNTTYHFSFRVPEGASVQSVQKTEESSIFLVRNPARKFEIQIAVFPFDEPGPITRERILQDVPDMVIKNPQNVLVGKNKFSALLFSGNVSGVGATREIWFIKNGYLFQVSTPSEFETDLGKMMETWEGR